MLPIGNARTVQKRGERAHSGGSRVSRQPMSSHFGALGR